MQTRETTTAARVLVFLFEVLRPLFLLVGFVLRVIYKTLFSWWMNPLFDRWIRNGFAEDITEAIPSLFGLHGGRVVPDPKPYVTDENMDYLCVASTCLILKVRRWHRENYGVQVAPTFAPTEFYDVLDALHLLDPTANTKLPMLDVSSRFWGQLLEPRFQLLERAFGMENFQDTKDRLAS